MMMMTMMMKMMVKSNKTIGCLLQANQHDSRPCVRCPRQSLSNRLREDLSSTNSMNLHRGLA